MTLKKLYTAILTGGVSAFFLLTIVGGSFLTFAAEKSAQDQKQSELDRIEVEWQKYQEKVDAKYTPKISTHENRLSELRQELEKNLQEFDGRQKVVSEQEKALEILGSRVNTLQGQFARLSSSLKLSQEKVQVTEEQIAIRESGLAKVMTEKEKVAVEAEAQKNIVMSYFSLLQTDADAFESQDVTSGLKVILSNDSFTKNLREEMHLNALEKTARVIFHNLENSMTELEETDLLLSQERESLQKLHNRLQIERDSLASQRESQKVLLAETQGEEQRFEKLYAESQQQMVESAEAIAAIKNDIGSIEEKLKLLDSNKKFDQKKLSKEKIQELLKGVDADYDVGEDFLKQDQEKKPLAWPVDPLKITAYFHDASYKEAFHVEHNAIDIRAPQGTAIHAPAAGYVYKTVDNGLGYSYIILIHQLNLMTVYGHVSGFSVHEGDLVQKGDVIGFTGGTPGTKGAGLMTTAAHLHFEVWENSVVKNPLDYLPLEELQPEDVPREYLIQDLKKGR